MLKKKSFIFNFNNAQNKLRINNFQWIEIYKTFENELKILDFYKKIVKIIKKKFKIFFLLLNDLISWDYTKNFAIWFYIQWLKILITKKTNWKNKKK